MYQVFKCLKTMSFFRRRLAAVQFQSTSEPSPRAAPSPAGLGRGLAPCQPEFDLGQRWRSLFAR